MAEDPQQQHAPATPSLRASLGTMQRLFDAFLDVSTGLDLDETLRHIVEAGVALIDAQYGTLGLLDSAGVMVAYVHVGPDAQHAAEPRPLRSVDRETVSFLSVPVTSRGETLGTLYFTAKRDAPFSAEDDTVLTALAGAAGIAIANARLYEGRRRAASGSPRSPTCGTRCCRASRRRTSSTSWSTAWPC